MAEQYRGAALNDDAKAGKCRGRATCCPFLLGEATLAQITSTVEVVRQATRVAHWEDRQLFKAPGVRRLKRALPALVEHEAVQAQ